MPRRLTGRGPAAARGVRRYAAVAGPHGVHVVEYARGRQELEVVEEMRPEGRPVDAPELVGLLARAVSALGGRGGELSLGLSGFGTAHHVLALPDAEDAVLRPVVRRELLRYYPDLEDPVIDFLRAAEAERGPEPKREVLVGAAPSRLVHQLDSGLRARRIRLRHLTVLPQVLQNLYDAFDRTHRSAVLLLVLDSGPLIGCFHEGAIRLFIEPPHDLHGRPVRAPQALVEQVERANLFLRQQFPMAGTSRVLLGASDAEQDVLQAALVATLDTEVKVLPGPSVGALAALGAALSADAEERIELLPPALRPLAPAQRTTRLLAAGAAALVAAAALWWAGAGLLVARAEAAAVRTAETRLEARLPWAEQARTLLERRQAHEHRLLFLDRTAATRSEIRRILAAVSATAGPAVRLETIRVEPAADGWRVGLTGQAMGAGSAAAVRSVDALYRGLPQRLPVADVELGDLEVVAGGGVAPVALAFDMSFIVRQESDLQR